MQSCLGQMTAAVRDVPCSESGQLILYVNTLLLNSSRDVWIQKAQKGERFTDACHVQWYLFIK